MNWSLRAYCLLGSTFPAMRSRDFPGLPCSNCVISGLRRRILRVWTRAPAHVVERLVQRWWPRGDTTRPAHVLESGLRDMVRQIRLGSVPNPRARSTPKRPLRWIARMGFSLTVSPSGKRWQAGCPHHGGLGCRTRLTVHVARTEWLGDWFGPFSPHMMRCWGTATIDDLTDHRIALINLRAPAAVSRHPVTGQGRCYHGSVNILAGSQGDAAQFAQVFREPPRDQRRPALQDRKTPSAQNHASRYHATRFYRREKGRLDPLMARHDPLPGPSRACHCGLSIQTDRRRTEAPDVVGPVRRPRAQPQHHRSIAVLGNGSDPPS